MAATLGAVTVVVGAQLIGVAPPAGHISSYCDQAYQCIQPLGDPLIPYGAHPLVQHANGDPNPLIPYGTNLTSTVPGYHVDNHDEANTTNGFVDVPF